MRAAGEKKKTHNLELIKRARRKGRASEASKEGGIKRKLSLLREKEIDNVSRETRKEKGTGPSGGEGEKRCSRGDWKLALLPTGKFRKTGFFEKKDGGCRALSRAVGKKAERGRTTSPLDMGGGAHLLRSGRG